jgi:hypothetical protein
MIVLWLSKSNIFIHWKWLLDSVDLLYDFWSFESAMSAGDVFYLSRWHVVFLLKFYLCCDYCRYLFPLESSNLCDYVWCYRPVQLGMSLTGRPTTSLKGRVLRLSIQSPVSESIQFMVWAQFITLLSKICLSITQHIGYNIETKFQMDFTSTWCKQ